MKNQRNKYLELFRLISTKEITLLKDLDRKIWISKKSKFNHTTFQELNYNNVYDFLCSLEHERFYILIPILSVNNCIDEPYVILSRQILITRYSNEQLLINFIRHKIFSLFNLFDINELEKFHIVFKYREINFEIDKYDTFK
jgi:hypothetical protein